MSSTSSLVNSYNYILGDDKLLKEDSRLKNWSLWLKRRQKQFEKLCPELNRKPECLVMNYEHNVNEMLDKRLIEEASKFTYADKFGGSPHFWKTVKPTKKGRRNGIETLVYPGNERFSDDPKVFYKKGYTDIPTLVLEEKYSNGCKTRLKARAKNQCTIKRKNELSKVNLLEPFRPDLKDLAIKGVGFVKGIGFKSNIPNISAPDIEYHLLPEEEEFETNFTSIKDPIVKIGNTTITCQNCVDNLQQQNCSWCVTFLNKTTYDVHIQFVTFENVGPTAVHYKWKEIKFHTRFPIKYSKFRTPKFFFDKSPGIMVPGTSFSIQFEFRTNTPGHFRELWELLTFPKVNAQPLYFILQGIASENPNSYTNKTGKEIELYINECVKNFMIKEKVESLYFCKPAILKTNYLSLFLTKEMFEYNNPGMVYNPYLVKSCQTLRSKFNTNKWDMNMKSIRKDIIKREDCTLRHNYLQELNAIIQQMKMPCFEDQLSDIKYDSAYLIMSTFVSQISKTATILQKMFNIKSIPKIKSTPQKFDLTRSWENLRTIKILEKSSSDEEFFKDFGEGFENTSRRHSRRSSKRRQSSRRKSSKRRQSSTRRSSKRKQSTRGKEDKRRVSTRKKTSSKSPSPGSESRKQGKHSEKDLGKEKGKHHAVVKPPFIKLALEKPKPVKSDYIPSEIHPDRKKYVQLLTAYVKDYLREAIDKVCTIVDATNSVYVEKKKEINLAFEDDGCREVIPPEKPQIEKDDENKN